MHRLVRGFRFMKYIQGLRLILDILLLKMSLRYY
ncbi:protein of unknown function [Magnetospirillum sp. XM-1]|nr:protein of unknown function [Magnetospirillum sp. XM-1]